MDSTRRDYSCNSINGSTRINRPDMTKIGLEDSKWVLELKCCW
jgi:hypothetical protein